MQTNEDLLSTVVASPIEDLLSTKQCGAYNKAKSASKCEIMYVVWKVPQKNSSTQSCKAAVELAMTREGARKDMYSTG